MQLKGYFTNIFIESAFSLFFVHDNGKVFFLKKKKLKFDWGEAGFVSLDLLTE